MTDYVIPCDTIARLAPLVHGSEDWFNTIRIDNGQVIATDRRIMAIENIGGSSGIIHFKPFPMIVDLCKKHYDKSLTIIVNEMLKFAIATLPGIELPAVNCVNWADTPNIFNNWRSMVMRAKEPAKKSTGAMAWQGNLVAKLCGSSPTGNVVFETNIDVMSNRPTLIRDELEEKWLGVFNPWVDDVKRDVAPAIMPDWMSL